MKYVTDSSRENERGLRGATGRRLRAPRPDPGEPTAGEDIGAQLPEPARLRGRFIDAAKSALEAACPGKVSCADVVAFAGRDASAVLSGGRADFAMPAGRCDRRVSLSSEALQFLPPPVRRQLVVLSGAHTVGRRSHCSCLVKRRRLPQRARRRPT
jgi:peroxidase